MRLTFRRPLVFVLLVGALALATAASFSSTHGPGFREVVLVARGMAYYLEGDSAPNPVIRLRAGERVRLTLRNEAPGFVHDLAVASMGVDVGPLASGEQQSATFTAPAASGRHEYVCRPHAVMMRGWIEVASP